ncbi:unnamed protein product [Schistocephalus solidus]|uniref:C2H2-type domain-containing protein n=1 Tax=Schistocephalus solidus TaxID=70667 RepID=A0A183T141_SCHSO|nr:unnamed protein product [Schistocephalus solidus]
MTVTQMRTFKPPPQVKVGKRTGITVRLARPASSHSFWPSSSDSVFSRTQNCSCGLHSPAPGLELPDRLGETTIRAGQLSDVGVDALADSPTYPSSRATARPGPHNAYQDSLNQGIWRSHRRLTPNPLDSSASRRSVKTGLAIYEANRIAVAKAKRAARKSPAPRTNIVDAQALPTCTHCQRIFHAPTLIPGINSITPTIIETTSLYSSPVTRTTTFAFTSTTISDGDSLLTCPHCNRTFISRIGLVVHLRIHRTQTGEPVSGAPTHGRDRRLHCLHCPRAFTHRMGLFGHMRIHDSGIHRIADNTDTSCTPSTPAILTAAATPTTMNAIPPASTDFSCLHCTRNFKSRIGLLGHLRIHRTEADEPVPGAPTYSRRARLHCPYCSRTLTHRMGLLGHMCLRNNLREQASSLSTEKRGGSYDGRSIDSLGCGEKFLLFVAFRIPLDLLGLVDHSGVLYLPHPLLY